MYTNIHSTLENADIFKVIVSIYNQLLFIENLQSKTVPELYFGELRIIINYLICVRTNKDCGNNRNYRSVC